jgi:hypothetical protein
MNSIDDATKRYTIRELSRCVAAEDRAVGCIVAELEVAEEELRALTAREAAIAAYWPTVDLYRVATRNLLVLVVQICDAASRR